jgi:hypothetical protein
MDFARLRRTSSRQARHGGEQALGRLQFTAGPEDNERSRLAILNTF